MRKRTYFVTATPQYVRDSFGYPVPPNQIETLTVELRCTSMGRNNNAKLLVLACAACRRWTEERGWDNGGAAISLPKEKGGAQ